MDIPYRQLDPSAALRVYADWLLAQRIDSPWPFFRCIQRGVQAAEWYMITYPLRALLLASDVLGDEQYGEAAFAFLDRYCDEQLPNGAFTSNFRRQPTETLSKAAFHEILRTGKVNLADNGSNVLALVHAATRADAARRARYLDAAQRWFDNWVPIWALPDGGYGNGIWNGHKINTPYTCAMSTLVAAQAAYSRVTGDREQIGYAERCMAYQCGQWHEDGRPLFMDCYPQPRTRILEDLSHSFYLLEGMCWTHAVSTDAAARGLLAARMHEWFHAERGLLSQWYGSWFNLQLAGQPPEPDEMPGTRCGLRPGWEQAKSNGIVHAMLYYLNHIDDDPEIRDKAERGLRYLSHPLLARMTGVAAEPEESHGMFAVQAAGFAGLSLAEGIRADCVFALPESGA
jgi:hypothetical protein